MSAYQASLKIAKVYAVPRNKLKQFIRYKNAKRSPKLLRLQYVK